MTVSDLIIELQEFYQEHGDMQVTVDVSNATEGVLLEDPVLRTTPTSLFFMGEREPQDVCVLELEPTPESALRWFTRQSDRQAGR